MGIFDSLMSGASSIREKNSPTRQKSESIFRKIGRMTLAPMGMANLIPKPEEQELPVQKPEFIEEPQELPVGELPPLNTREIPEDSVLIGQEALDLYPPDSEVGQIIQKGYSLVSDPKNGSIIGVGDGQGHLLSPDEAMKQKPVPQILQENGFHPTPDNVDRFLKQNGNISTEIKDLNFVGLKPMSDDVIMKSPVDAMLDAVYQTPVLQTLTALKNPLEILGEAFGRYESLKTSILMGAVPFAPNLEANKNVLRSFSGTAETEFPEASLRVGKAPELGDIFRKMGMPELASATAGLTLDLITDGVILGVAGKGLKTALRGMKFGEENGLEYVTKRWNKFRSQHNVRVVEDLAKGKRSTDIEGSAEFANLERQIFGKKSVAILDAENAKNEVERMVNVFSKGGVDEFGNKTRKYNPDDLYEKINNMMHDKDLLDSGGDIPKELHTIVRSWVVAKDKISMDIAEGLRRVVRKNPEWAESVRKEFSIKAGKEIPIEALPDVIASQEGSYVTRAYEMFSNKNWIAPKAGSKEYDNLLRGLMEEFDMSEALAKKRIDQISSTGSIHFPERSKITKQNLDINKGSFIARQQIPSYLREFMGEIKNPLFNMENTTRNLADTRYKLQLFEMIDDAGLASKEAIPELGRTIKVKGDSLAWGSINDKYIAEDLNDLLTTVRATDDLLEGPYLAMLRFYKRMKTTANPPGHVRQSIQNLGASAGFVGVSPFNPKNWKNLYLGEGNTFDILSDAVKQKHNLGKTNPKNIALYRQMVEDGLLGVELPTAELPTHLKNLSTKIEAGSLDLPAMPGSVSEIFGQLANGIKTAGKIGDEAWALEDMVVKVAAYLKRTRAGMSGKDAVAEIFKFIPNYREASRFAKYVRNSPTAMIGITPFFTFKSEQHRILLNIIKEGTMAQKIWLAGTMGGRFAINTALLAAAGNGLKDIKELYMSKPELISESMLNPAAMESGEFDINMKYVDPFNTTGIFAPLLVHSKASGVNVLDYLLDFTNFSPEFGYGSIVPDSLEALLTGRGKFGQELSAKDRILETIKGVGPSYLSNIPKVFDESLAPNERIRKAFKLVGLDFEKRNAPWIKSTVKKRLEQKIANGEDPTATINAIEAIGFDPQVMLKAINKKLQKGKPIEKKKETPKDVAVAKALAEFGF